MTYTSIGPSDRVDRTKLRYLWAYSGGGSDFVHRWHCRLLQRRLARGFDVVNFCISPPQLGHWLTFDQLDRKWRLGDPTLLRMYEQLAELAEQCDVLVLFNGKNLHPEFVRQLSIVKVYTSGDDPESWDLISKHLAPEFDIHLINNIACLDLYRSIGCEYVHFWPLGSLTLEDDVVDLSPDVIADMSRRTIPIAFIGDRNRLKRARLDELVTAFPGAKCRGLKWPSGFADFDEMWATYRLTQIGWNIHNSTGPINFRTYDLAATGVMQICDNKSYLGQIYDLDEECCGFDSIDDCIDLTRYYLSHVEEQRAIAVAAWTRWKACYSPDRIWDRLVAIVEGRVSNIDSRDSRSDIGAFLRRRQLRRTPLRALSRLRKALYNRTYPIRKHLKSTRKSPS